MQLQVVDTPGSAESLDVAGTYAYVADATGGLRVIDVSDPANPQEVGNNNGFRNALRVGVSEGYAYVANSDDLRVVDVSDPTNPVEVGYAPGGAQGVSVHFNTNQLPCFSLWKNTADPADGCVTGLEPGSSTSVIEKQLRILPSTRGLRYFSF